jgi:enterochelin esterase-like enzyme
MSIQTSAVAIMDWTTWQTTNYPDVTKYTITVCDPNGAQVATFDVINGNDKTAEQLTGSYTIVSDAHDAMQISAGYSLPDYGMAGGSSYVDAAGNTQYLTGGGTVEITSAEGIDGSTLYSFKGTGLGTTDAAGATGTGSFNIMFVSFIEVKGSVVRDITIDSQILGTQMKYSVYLPEGYDGQTTLPVLYMLHGYGDDQNSWLDKGDLAALTSNAITNGEVGKMVVVTPDAKQTFYCNGYQDEMAYEDYFFQELLPTIEAMFNVGKEKSKRAVGGLSMGGYGTLYYAVKHPEMFCCAYAMSPATYISETTPNLFELYPAANAAELPELTIEVGTEDATVYESCAAFNAWVLSGIPSIQYIERAGVHDWAFWKGCYPKFLTKLGTYFK